MYVFFSYFLRAKELKALFGSFLQKPDLSIIGHSHKTDKLRSDTLKKTMLYVYTDFFLNIIKKCCLGNEGDHAQPDELT